MLLTAGVFGFCFILFPQRNQVVSGLQQSDAEPGKEAGCRSAERTVTLETLHGSEDIVGRTLQK